MRMDRKIAAAMAALLALSGCGGYRPIEGGDYFTRSIEEFQNDPQLTENRPGMAYTFHTGLTARDVQARLKYCTVMVGQNGAGGAGAYRVTDSSTERMMRMDVSESETSFARVEMPVTDLAPYTATPVTVLSRGWALGGGGWGPTIQAWVNGGNACTW